jgi:zinc transport system substrate-binding protein
MKKRQIGTNYISKSSKVFVRRLARGLLTIFWVLLICSFPAHANKGVVYTTNYPLYFFASSLAGNNLDVVFPVPPNVDPAYWKPDAETLVRFQKAGIVLLNGAGFEKWVATASLPRGRVVDTSRSFKTELITQPSDQMPHVHGPEGAHVHDEATAFTTWLDMTIARKHAVAVRDALTRRWPELQDAIDSRHERLDASLEDLDLQLTRATQRYKGLPVIASHPVYQYFARRYKVNMRSLHWEPDTHPDAQQWNLLDELLATHPAKTMIWEGLPTPATQQALDKLGIKIVVFPTLTNKPEQGDFLSSMQHAAAALAAE